MKVRVVPSAPGADASRQFLTTMVVDDVLAIDAGALGLWAHGDEMSGVRDVVITHSHLDHVATLPLHVERMSDQDQILRIHGSAATIEALRSDLFNDRLWPDLERIAAIAGRDFFELLTLEAETTVEIAGKRITPVEVSHIVPTFGFVVEDDAGCVVFGADSGPTDRIWQVARERGPVRGVFLEASFPDRMGELATVAAHLTPALFAREVRKLPSESTVVAVHIKPSCHHEVTTELSALGLENLVIATGGSIYSF